ncbi:MAG: type II secretion system protein J [Elainellaceae cyanobacterium]
MGQTQAGFTFAELLVVMLLAGGIASVTLHLATTLLSANQRHMRRDQVHTDLKRSLNYMTEDLQQAVYVYDGLCLGPGGGQVAASGCPGLANHLPSTLTPERDRYPVLAFWRPTPLSATLMQRCRRGSLAAPECQSQQAYTLVVYVISTLDDSALWQGEARLLRYKLSKFRQSGAPVPGYVNPRRQQFRTWPWYYSGSAALANQQTQRPSLQGSAPVPLVDFIDFSVGSPQLAACPAGYRPTAAAAVLSQVDSVLGCVSENQEVILTLRGHLPAAGRTGSTASALTLQTRVFPRPRLDYLPPD